MHKPKMFDVMDPPRFIPEDFSKFFDGRQNGRNHASSVVLCLVIIIGIFYGQLEFKESVGRGGLCVILTNSQWDSQKRSLTETTTPVQLAKMETSATDL